MMAIHNETLVSTDGLELYRTTWQPAGLSRAHFVVIHGMGEHAGRYNHMAQILNDAGISVDAVDLRGHGQSGGRRGHTPSLQAYLDDITQLLDSLEGDQPIFLYGHSLGGLIIIHYAFQHQNKLQGLIISAPALERKLEVPLYKLVLGRAMSSIWPSFTQPSGLNPDDLSRVKEVAEAYRADPLVHDKVTARFFTSITDAGPVAIRRASEIHIPVVVIQGGQDHIIAAEASQQFFEQVSSSDKTWIFIPEAFHETHNEADGDKVIRQIVDWVLEHLE